MESQIDWHRQASGHYFNFYYISFLLVFALLHLQTCLENNFTLHTNFLKTGQNCRKFSSEKKNWAGFISFCINKMVMVMKDKNDNYGKICESLIIEVKVKIKTCKNSTFILNNTLLHYNQGHGTF